MIHRIHERRVFPAVEPDAGETGKRRPQFRCHLTDLDEAHHVRQKPGDPSIVGGDNLVEGFAFVGCFGHADQKAPELVDDPRLERTAWDVRRRRIAGLEVCRRLDQTYGSRGTGGLETGSGRTSRDHEEDHGSDESHRVPSNHSPR